MLNGGGPVASTGSGVVTLNLHTLVSQLAGTLGLSSQVAALQSKLKGSTGAAARTTAQQKLGITLPPSNGQLVILRSNQLKTAQDIANAVKHLAIVLPGIAFLLFALAVYLARGRRRRTLRTTGWCFVLIGVVLLLIRRIAGDAVVDGLVKVPSNKPAVHDVWNIGTSLLRDIAVAMIAYGTCSWRPPGSPAQPAPRRRSERPWPRRCGIAPRSRTPPSAPRCCCSCCGGRRRHCGISGGSWRSPLCLRSASRCSDARPPWNSPASSAARRCTTSKRSEPNPRRQGRALTTPGDRASDGESGEANAAPVPSARVETLERLAARRDRARSPTTSTRPRRHSS